MQHSKLIDNMTWSFSRLHMYEQCRYAFYLKYIEKREGESNFYASNGKSMHEVFESLFKQEIEINDCPKAYSDKFDLICEEVRPSVMENAYVKCIDYLCEMDDIDRETYEIIGVEMKLEFTIHGLKFQGYADLVIRNKITGEVILVDHKQATHFMKKDGVTPLKGQLDNYLAYKKQMYIYCMGLRKQYGIQLDKLAWHHFKDGGAVTVIPYEENEEIEAINWAMSVIDEIKHDETFEAIHSYMSCKELCDFRNDCEYQGM